MKVLLINPTNKIQSNLPYMIEKAGMVFPSLGLLYVSSFLKNEGRHTVKVIDMGVEDCDLSYFRKMLRIENPGVIGFYTTSFNLVDIILMTKIIKGFNPRIHICLGGPHVNIYPNETMSAIYGVDSIVLGEGEVTFARLVDALEEKKELSLLGGILYKDSGRIVKTGPPQPIEDLDALPFPDRRLVPLDKCYSAVSHDFPSATMIASRGCPYKCTFCYHSYSGRLRFRGPDNIVSEMRECRDLGIKDIFFYDDTFILDRQRVIDICDSIIGDNLKLDWSVRTRVDNVDIETLKKLRKAGCKRVQFGVEATNPRILSVLNKEISVNQVKDAFRLARMAGIETLAYFMLGSPEEGIKDILETIDFAVRLNPDYVHFSATFPFPGTELYSIGLKRNIFKNDFWGEFAVNPELPFVPRLWEECLSEKELNRLLKYAYQRFYLRPEYILKIMLRPGSLRQFKRRVASAARLFKYIFN